MLIKDLGKTEDLTEKQVEFILEQCQWKGMSAEATRKTLELYAGLSEEEIFFHSSLDQGLVKSVYKKILIPGRVTEKQEVDDEKVEFNNTVAPELIQGNLKLAQTLRYLDDQFHFELFYYPGSGAHRTPKDTLGEYRVVHVSLHENRYMPHMGYDNKLLGPAIMVITDFRNSPFKDQVFDATLLWGIPESLETMPEFQRVTKKGGLLIAANNKVSHSCGGDELIASLDKRLEKVAIPKEYSDISVYKNP